MSGGKKHQSENTAGSSGATEGRRLRRGSIERIPRKHIFKPYGALLMGTGKRKAIRISPLFLLCAVDGGVIYQDRGQRR